jgi:hypothetical protein
MWARLGALASAVTLTASLTASVLVQRETHTPARAADCATQALVDDSITRAIHQAYVDDDLELADSLERLRAARAGVR